MFYNSLIFKKDGSGITMNYLTGDLLQLAKNGNFDVIAHGCNCMCTMGAGIAQSIKKEFPQAFLADCKTLRGQKSKLGSCSFAEIQLKDKILTVVNAYTQFDYKGKPPLVDYEALRSCMEWIRERFGDQKIGLPKIGAGLAGGDWNIIENIIETELYGLDVTIVVAE
jgi:O-acetyl-ADP-ribose deacetylase (regulator of RNase III)